MIDLDKAASRPLAVASAMLGQKIDEQTYFGKRVVLTGEADALATENGQWCYFDALMLLIRVVGELTIHLPEGAAALEPTVRSICRNMCFRSTPKVVIGNLDEVLPQVSAILNVGRLVRAELPWISITSAGWISRISTGGENLPGEMTPANPISSLFSASLGASEVFRLLIQVPIDKVPPLGFLEISLFDLESQAISSGPELPKEINLPNALLIGAGAIGSGVALLASQLPLRGSLHIIDKQAYGDENMGTCVVMGNKGWVAADKAVRLSRWLKESSALNVTGERAFVADAIRGRIYRDLKPTLVLNGLDDVQARHDAQLAWPDITIDGGISEFGVAVVQHRLDEKGLACLRCTFSLPTHDYQKIQQAATGLNEQSLRDQDRHLTMDDVANAAPEKREWLLGMLKEGRNVCSVVSEGVLQRLGANVVEDFRPSVPFVATAATALMLAETVKAVCFKANYRQLSTIHNLFLGRESIGFLDRPADKECLCVKQRNTIVAIQRKRQE